MFGRQKHFALLVESKTIIIQKRVRGWLARRRYQKVRYGFIKLQGHVRRRAAKRELKRLKIEARSIEHVKRTAKGLENKIISLQQRLDEKVSLTFLNQRCLLRILIGAQCINLHKSSKVNRRKVDSNKNSIFLWVV